MSTVLLLVVLAGWIGVGFWWFVTHRGAPSDAIGSFARQLGTLERRTPGSVAPANRLASTRSANALVAPYRAGHAAIVRAQMQKRRRDIFGGLALTTASTLVLGLLPPLRLLWLVTLVSGALLAGYCYLLVQLRTLAVERDMQLRFRSNHNQAPRTAHRPVYALVPDARPVRKRPVQDDELAYAYGADSPLLRRNAS